MFVSDGGGLPFYKMHGLGNDFVIIDQRRQASCVSQNVICRIGHRRLGLGCDQVILLRQPKQPDHEASILIYNTDGSSAEMCGNAVRCVANILVKETHKKAFSLETPGRSIHISVQGDAASYRPILDMGPPCFLPDTVGDSIHEYISGLFPNASPSFRPTVVSFGNLHAVFLVPNLEEIDLEEIGPHIEHHPAFPHGSNVELVQVHSPTHLRMRVWERGVGITLACGSGACAAFAAAFKNGQVNTHATVAMEGGALKLERRPDGHVLMEGPVSYVCAGFLDRSLFDD